MADDDDFEEDVIFPNSPLSQYLQGLENSEAANLIEKSAPAENKQEYNSAPAEAQPNAFSKKTHLLRHCKVCAHLIGSFFLLPYYVIFSSSLLSCSLLRFNCNNGNEFLIPEDEAFLESLLKSDNNIKLSPIRKLLKVWGLLTLILLILYYFIATNRNLFEICQMCCWITCTYAALLLFGTCVVVYCVLLDFYFISFYERMVQILKLMKRSIRLVQESELTARGFTTASSIGAAERIELSSVLPFNPSNKQCLKLRRFLFKWMKDIFLCYKAQTLYLLQNVPLDPLYDFSTSLAQLEIQEFGLFLTCDADSAEMSKLTDGFSISSLKTMYRLMEMQISEYFRCVCVILFFVSNNEKKDCCEQIWDVYSIRIAMSILSKASKPLLCEIRKTYHFYQSIEASYVRDSAGKTPKVVKTPLSKLKVTIHNMCLHLKAAMLRAVEVENLLLTVPESPLQKQLQAIDSLLQTVNNELLAFHDCSRESSEILYSLLHPEKKVSLETILPEKSDNNVALKVMEKCDIERVIEDEVFEATILTSTAEIGRSDWISSHVEDGKKNIDITAHLLSELKNVLVPKADEHRIREQKALAKMSGICGLEDAPSLECPGEDENEEPKDDIKKEDELSLNTNESDVDEFLAANTGISFPNPFLKTGDSFAASIASLAAHRQKMMGLSSDEYVVEGSDCTDSDSS